MKRINITISVSCFAALCVAGMIGAGCSQVQNAINTVAPPKATGMIDPGSKFYRSVTVADDKDAIGQSIALAATNRYSLVDDDRLQAYVTLVGMSVVSTSTDPNGHYVFGVLDTDVPTACSGPNGYIMITRGALMMMEDESELAGVLAHEISHVQSDDGIHLIEKSLQLEAGAQVASNLNSNVARFNSLTDHAVEQILDKGYSREQEFSADASAMRLLQAAGYDAGGYVRLLQRLQARSQSNSNLFSTHPGMQDRVARLNQPIAPGGQSLPNRFHQYVSR